MSTPTNLRELLQRDEGRKRSAYQDQYDLWTIGVGRMIDARKGGGLSEDEIDYLLDNDIRARVAALTASFDWFGNLDEVRRAVLVSMSFQMGVEGLEKFVRTLAAVHYGKYEEAASDMLESLWARQTPERAQRLANMMKTGEYE